MRLIDEEVLMMDIQNTITEKSSTIDWMNMITELFVQRIMTLIIRIGEYLIIRTN